MKLQPNSVELPGWMNEALGKLGVSKPFVSKEARAAVDVKSTVNLEDLPTVAYRDETFRVRFTNQGSAVLYNSYGNEVVVYEGCKTIEDVQEALEQGDVVRDVEGAVTEFDKELQRVSQGKATENTLKQLVAELGEVNRKVTALSEQFYAYSVVPNDAYDLHSQDVEVAHFQETAANTQYLIDKEHELDLARQSDRVKLNYEFLDSLTFKGEPLGEELINQIVAGIEGQLEPVAEPRSDVEPSLGEVDDLVPEVDNEVNATAAINVSTLRRVALSEEAEEQFFDQVCPACGEPGLVLNTKVKLDDDDYAALRCEACGMELYARVSEGDDLLCDDDAYERMAKAGTVLTEEEEKGDDE